MRPKICNKNPIVVIPFHEEDCEFWLVTTTNLDTIENPSKDHAYLLPNGYFYVFNGTKFVQVNDHSNLKVKWGNVIGDINNQTDLQNLFKEVNNKIDTNKQSINGIKEDITEINTEISKLKEKDTDLSEQINGIDYIKTISRNGTILQKNGDRNVNIEVPENVSELNNDLNYITEEEFDTESQKFVKGIRQNGLSLTMDSEQIVDITTPTKVSQLQDDVGFMSEDKYLNGIIETKSTENGQILIEDTTSCGILVKEIKGIPEESVFAIQVKDADSNQYLYNLYFSYPIRGDFKIDTNGKNIFLEINVMIVTDPKSVSFEILDSWSITYEKLSYKDCSISKIIGEIMNTRRDGKIYESKIWHFDVNPTSNCEKLQDNKGLVAEPSTDTVIGRDDYADIPLFQWFNCNYKRYKDGFAYPTALEGDNHYKTEGDVDVGVLRMTYWYKLEDKGDYDSLIISDSPNHALGLMPADEAVRQDGTVMPYFILSKYFVGEVNGLLRSQPNLKPKNFMSYTKCMTEFAKKGDGYFGGSCFRNTDQIIMLAIKYGTKNSQSVFTGCTNYNFQYQASIKSSKKDTYFPVTNAQAENILIGSNVLIGYPIKNSDGTINYDRGLASMREVVDLGRVKSKIRLDDENMKIFVDGVQNFSTESKMDGGVELPIYISSMQWNSGTTDNLPLKRDGSNVSNTDSKHPYRLMGCEYAVGQYYVPTDVVLTINQDYSKTVYHIPKGTKRFTDETNIKKFYKEVVRFKPYDENNSDAQIGDFGIVNGGISYPKSYGGSSTTGTGDRIYAGGQYTGIREYLLAGCLWSGSLAGSCLLRCWNGLSLAYWLIGVCD